MARRRKKYRKIPLRPRPVMPTIYECPNCGSRMLSVTLDKKSRNEQGLIKAVVRCGSCGLYAEMWVPEIYQLVDVYSKFLDGFLEGKVEYTFTKVEERGGASWEGGEISEEKS
jgi:transcription elongation factor Elf1